MVKTSLTVALLILLITLVNCSAVRDIDTSTEYVRPESKPNFQSVDLYTLGEQAFAEGNYLFAARLFQQADIFDFQNVTIKERLLETYLILADNDESYLDKIIERGKTYIEANLISPKIYRFIASAHLYKNEVEHGLYLLELALDIDPDPHQYYRYFLSLARFKNQVEFHYLEKALEIAWNYSNLVYNIAEVYEYYNPQKTKEILEKAYQIYDQNKESLEQLLDFYIRYQDWSSFMRLVSSRLEQGEIVPEYYEELYLSRLFYVEDYVEISKMFERYKLTDNPKIIKIIFYSSYQVEKYEQTIEMGNRLLSKNCIDQDEHNLVSIHVGTSFYHLNNLNKANEYFDKVNNPILLYGAFQLIAQTEDRKLEHFVKNLGEKELNPFTYTLIMTLIYLDQDKFEQAKKYLYDAMNIAEGNDDLWQAMAVMLLDSGLTGDAINVLKKVVVSDFKINTFLGDYYYHNKDDDLAKYYFERSIDDNKNISPYTFLTLASIYNRNQLFDKELELMEDAVKVYPKDPLILNWLGYTLTIRTERLEEAKDYLHRAIELDPNNHYIQDSVAWLYYQLDDYERALKYMEDIIASEVKDSIISYHLGMIYLKLDKTEKAKEYFELAIEIDNDQESVDKARSALSDKGVNYE